MKKPDIRQACAAMLPLAVLACSPQPAAAAPPVLQPVERLCVNARAIDGDTIKCGEPGARFSVRLSGIDSPELPGHCRVGRDCAPGDPFVARDLLARTMAGRRVTFQSFGIDRWGRPDALAWANSGTDRLNLSCTQLRGGAAIYVRRWDNGLRVARACR